MEENFQHQTLGLTALSQKVGKKKLTSYTTCMCNTCEKVGKKKLASYTTCMCNTCEKGETNLKIWHAFPHLNLRLLHNFQ